MPKTVKRLFQQFDPEHYTLRLSINPEKMSFKGKLVLKGRRTGRPSQRITLHQKELKITKAKVEKLEKGSKTSVKIDRINHHSKYDEVRLHSDQMIFPGQYEIELEFTGQISRQMNGLYPCFFAKDGKEEKLLATQFESHHAREVFPCIDEPEAKATFDLTVKAPSGKTIISNTPVKKQTESSGKTTTSFETTPIMSTYLLAFVYGELEYLEAKTKDGVLVRTYATPDKVEHTRFALDMSVKILEFYNQYFAIPYPLEKCDLIALPDFASGAMENWGCITFREQALIVDDKNSTLSNKQWVAMVVAHELAHQWFGNLVTMRWWTDLWLNEGFASWVEFLAVDEILPDWEMWTQFTVSDQQQALKLDALEHTHPVEVPVKHPDEIRSIFDAISYSKGASVIHMLHDFLGPEWFRDGLRHYLNKHKYGNTDTVDLWTALQEVSGKPVKDFMHAWTSQSGYPILKTNVSETQVEISQERFFLNPRHGEHESQTWPVPLLSNQLPDQLSAKSGSFKINDSSKLLLNTGQSGFYRVAYNSTHLERLGRMIKTGHMQPLDRLGLLSDVFETARAGQTDTADALHFLENFRSEDNYAVWEVIANSLGNTRLVMDSEEIRELMKPYVRDLTANELERLGWDQSSTDSHFDKLLRPIILGQAAIADHPEIVKHCRKLFDRITAPEDLKPNLRQSKSTSEVKRGVDIDPDMRGVVFGTIARIGDKSDFEKMVKMHNTSTLSEERTTLAAAITNFHQPSLINRALHMIDSDNVRLQDVSYWLAYSFLNRFAKRQTWEWLKDHWKWLENSLGSDLSFYRTPIYAARVYSDEKFIDEYKAFFEPKLSPALERSYNQGLEILEWHSEWKKRDQKEVLAFFRDASHRLSK